MNLQIILLPIMTTILSSIDNAEMPQSPNFEELCGQSKIIMCGEPIRDQKRTLGLFRKEKYNIITFKIHKVYKGDNETKEINVLIPIDRYKKCFIEPVYNEGEKYLLFLKKRLFSELYVRVKLDDIWGERRWNENKEKQIVEEIRFLSDSERWEKPGDNLDYVIPDDANEKLADLTDYQRKTGYSKKAEYWLNGKLVGERAWYGNGQVAFEMPIKNGMRHGAYKAWYPDGKRWEEVPYRKDRLHGILKRWGKNHHITITYWVRGKRVNEITYIKMSKNNATLPRYEYEELRTQNK